MKRLGKRLSWIMAGSRAAARWIGSARVAGRAVHARRTSGLAGAPSRKFIERVAPDDIGNCSAEIAAARHSPAPILLESGEASQRPSASAPGLRHEDTQMDMGIAGRTALVCAASKGLG